MSRAIAELKKLVKAANAEAAEAAKVIPRYHSEEYKAASQMAYRTADLLVSAVCEQIENAPTPMPRGKEMRYAGRKVQAAAVRALCKDLGVEAVSVTAPNYSMAQAIHIKVPASSHCAHGDVKYEDCPRCQRRHAAVERLEGLILAAYPDLNNRSDYQTDYFDYRLSIH